MRQRDRQIGMTETDNETEAMSETDNETERHRQ